MVTLRETIDADVKNVFMDVEGFAEGFTFSRTSLSVAAVFDDEFTVVVDDVESTSPAIMVADSDIPGIIHGDTFTRDSDSTIYNVAGIEPDGTGITVVLLSQD